MKHIKLVPLALLCAFTIKLLLLGTSASEMGAIFVLAGLSGFTEFLDRSKRIQEIESNVKTQLDEVRSIVARQNDVIQKMAIQLDDAKAGVTAVKLAQGMSTGMKRSG